jgi:hypothetical protein
LPSRSRRPFASSRSNLPKRTCTAVDAGTGRAGVVRPGLTL